MANLNKSPNAGRMSAADANRTIVNAGRKKTQATTTIVQQIGGGGAGSSVTVTAPLQMSGSVVSLPQATGSVSGYLLSADWSTFNAKMTNPMTTAGDLILGGSGGTPTRLGIGTSTYVLTSNGTTASWQAAGGGGGSGLFAASIVAPPALASFTWLNQGTASANQNATSVYMAIPTAVALNWRILYKAPAFTAPYTVITFIRSLQDPLNSQTAGMCFYDSGSGKLYVFECLSQTTGYKMRVERLTNVTTDASSLYSGTFGQSTTAQGGMWCKIRNDGTTLYFDISVDGENWRNLASEAIGTFLTPDNVGFGGVNANSGSPIDLSLISWSELNVATL